MRRMFFNKKSKKKSEPMEIDITSLLDVLVILLVFLLKSYNASDLKLNLVKDLVVPTSDARKLGHHAVVVQVDSNKKLYVNSKQIGVIRGSGENADLLQRLKEIKEEDKLRSPASTAVRAINLVFDQGVPYKFMKGVMHTSAIAGYTEFKFIVQGNY
ncbi:MAG: biopolymer transport protein ExbD [Bacteriovoracaceae bacterium]|jgi:biopolymer transport protein ExbD